MITRHFVSLLLVLMVSPLVNGQTQAKAKKPNVIVIMTDDQGFGDLGAHGNPIIKTPTLDKFARQSVRMRNFHVSPVCAPTRSSLLTGRYNYRTGVVDTFQGRALMHGEEITLAEILRALGYRTGIFGKWHLGDNFPLRAIDQGFDESLILKGGGIGQPSDPPGGESYFNPILQHNGKAIQKDGYVSDIITDAAIAFVTKNKNDPFFCYLPFNCPHTPLEVPKKYHDMYKGKIKLDAFPKVGFPVEGKVDLDGTAKIYGMITNIDDNLARLFAKLDELGIADDTIVIFLSDNGPQQPRYNGGLRGRKASVFEGGTHVPFFVRWPAGFKGDRDIDPIAAHIDITPTLTAACGGAMPRDRVIDGKNLLPLWKGDKTAWPDRALFFQWHRGNVPERYRAFAVRTQQWRLVQPVGVAEGSKFDKTRLMLFDIQKDPYEAKDVAAGHPEVVARLKKQYDAWFDDVKSTRNFQPPAIVVGSAQENPTVLTRQDMRDGKFWIVKAEKPGVFDIEVTLQKPAGQNTSVQLTVLKETHRTNPKANDRTVVLRGIKLPDNPIRLEPVAVDGDTAIGVRYVQIRRIK